MPHSFEAAEIYFHHNPLKSLVVIFRENIFCKISCQVKWIETGNQYDVKKP